MRCTTLLRLTTRSKVPLSSFGAVALIASDFVEPRSRLTLSCELSRHLRKQPKVEREAQVSIRSSI